MSDTMLELRGISASYGAIQALSNVSLKVNQGAIVALLGSNGAGKSTTLNAVSHLIEPTKGEVFFDGELTDLNRKSVSGKVTQILKGTAPDDIDNGFIFHVFDLEKAEVLET